MGRLKSADWGSAGQSLAVQLRGNFGRKGDQLAGGEAFRFNRDGNGDELMERCFSTIAIKALDEELRLIRGVASTPEPDRVGDIVEPLGLRFRNPVSLLWQHQHASPVGSCKFDKPTKAGITFEATLPRVDEPGVFRDQVDHAWHAVRHGVCRAVSIGFKSLDHEALPGGGLRFKKAELLELSLVSVPANAAATITEVRSIDAAIRRGEAPAMQLPTGSLWDRLSRIGLTKLDEFEAGESFKKLGQYGPQVSAARSVQEMIKALAGHVEEMERRLTESSMQ